ncbi:MAG: aminopeptidase P family protein [Rhodobacteraceae bacterium]|nr:aminopeptidase P family protein [Paracoccaceae bacterium]
MEPSIYADRLAKTCASSELAFPEASYRTRLKAVRKRMENAGLDTLLVTHSCDLNYLTGFDTICFDIYACLILPLEGDPVFHTLTVEIPATVNTTWIEDRVFGEWYQPESVGNQLAGLMDARGLAKGIIGVQPGRQGLSVATHACLHVNLPNATLRDHTDLVSEIRMIKSDEEIGCLRRAAEITASGIDASLAVIRVGATDNDVCRAGFGAMLAVGSDFPAIQPIVTTGVRTGGGHQTHKRNGIQAGDFVFMEYGGCYKRYTAPLMRCASFGDPGAEARAVEAAVLASVQALVDGIRPGRIFHDVAMEAKTAHREIDDLAYFSGAYGYTVGIGFPPTWAETIGFISQGAEDIFQPGMVFHLPIAMRVPGRYGVSLSETVRVTQTGCEVLTKHPRKLQVIDL